MNPAFGVALIPSLYDYVAHTTYHCAEAAYVSISLRIITPLYIPIEGWRPCRGSQALLFSRTTISCVARQSRQIAAMSPQ